MKFLTLICSAILISNTACGMSPIANHRSPDRSMKAQAPVGCQFELKTENLCASLTWVKEPNRDDEGEFTLKFWKNDATSTVEGPYVTPAAPTVFVKLWMPSMGHGSQKVVLESKKDDQGNPLTGIYKGSSVYFVMGGAWDIQLQLKDSAGKVTDQAKISYDAQ